MSDYKVLYEKQPDGSFTPIGPNGPLILQKNIINPSTVLLPADEASNLTIFYVSPDGNDENDGQSVDKPFEHIGKAFDLSQRTLGTIHIRLKGGLTSGVLPLYLMPGATLYKGLSARNTPFLNINAWDFVSDSDPSSTLMAAISPPVVETASVEVNIRTRGILFTSPNYGEGFGTNNIGLANTWQFTGNFEFIDSTLVGALFLNAHAVFFGSVGFYNSTMRSSCVYFSHMSQGHVNLYNGQKANVYFRGIDSADAVRCNVNSYLYMVPEVCNIASDGSFNLKAWLDDGAILAVKTNINSLPGTGTAVDEISKIY